MYWKYIRELDAKILNTFKCTDEPIVEEYLINEALKNDLELYTTTRVLIDDQSNIIGYYSMYNDIVTVGGDKKRKFDIQHWTSINSFPSVRLHYLGVSDEFRKQGYGKKILKEVLKQTKAIVEMSGCMFITAEAINDNAFKFNEKYGFKKFRNIKGKRIASEPELMLLKLNSLIG
ncbi:GNAT family N-acetyltransferase [Lysinibacillus fusiformis]|uniref:GNAT family N-acetyltransferase n=1 Tax=Lysinibacillus sp. PWR01 TaxID=3342384 RepID=UPI00372D1715